MKSMMKMAAVLGLLVLGTGVVWADPVPSNDKYSLTIRIRPNVDYGVQIDTSAYVSGSPAVIDLGAVDLYTATQTVKPATVTVLGNVSANGGVGGQELDLTAAITGGWSFDTTPTVGGTSGALNELAMYAMFTATTDPDAPTSADFDDTGSTNRAYASAAGTAVRVGGSGGAGVKFEDGSLNMDNKSVGDKAHLWFLFRLPNETNTTGDQDIQVTLTATGTTL